MSSSSAISNDPGDKETKASGHDNGIVIGSAVGGGVVLGILVVLSIVICWKRRKPGSILVETPEYANPGTEIQLETTNESYTSPTAQDDQPTYQGLLNDNRQSNVAVNNSAESNYVNCPVYQTLNEKNPGTLVYQLPVYQSNGQPTNSSYEIQLETPKARTSPIAQDDQPTYQGLLSENRQSNLAATYNRAEGSYENCPVYHTLNKKNPGTPVYQSPVHQSKGLPGGASTGINEEQDGHGTQYEPLRRPWTRPELGPPLASSYNPRIEGRSGEMSWWCYPRKNLSRHKIRNSEDFKVKNCKFSCPFVRKKRPYQEFKLFKERLVFSRFYQHFL